MRCEASPMIVDGPSSPNTTNGGSTTTENSFGSRLASVG